MNGNKNMVDERFECAAVIFRLANRPEFNYLISDYQKELAETFYKFANHEAVEYARKLNFGNDKVLKFAVHIKKEDKFIFIDDIRSLYDNINYWNFENGKIFLDLLNKFYFDTNFGAFFNLHIELFENLTKKFVNETYSKIDLEWFKKYINPSNLKCIYSMSSHSYSTTVNDKYIYIAVNGRGAIVHEYCHGFANKIANEWYKKNAEFKKWCDEVITINEHPYNSGGISMANEYVTRAYNILYKTQHGENLMNAF